MQHFARCVSSLDILFLLLTDGERPTPGLLKPATHGRAGHKKHYMCGPDVRLMCRWLYS